jgi:hypothetical protein
MIFYRPHRVLVRQLYYCVQMSNGGNGPAYVGK